MAKNEREHENTGICELPYSYNWFSIVLMTIAMIFSEIDVTMNVNLSLKNLKPILKNKFRSLFLNQLIDYFNPEINSIEALSR